HPLVNIYIEQFGEYLAAFLGFAAQKYVELALGKNDGLYEAAKIQSYDALYLVVYVRDAAGRGFPFAAIPPFQPGGHRRSANGSRHLVLFGPHAKLQQHRHAVGALADKIPAGLVQPRSLAIQRISDSVQERSFT